MLDTKYRGYHIYYDPPPIPVRTMDWGYTHEEYDGPEDNRCGRVATEQACKDAIDEALDYNDY